MVADTHMMFARDDGEPIVFTTPHSLVSWFEYIKEMAPALEKAGCPFEEILYVAERILVLCESCELRYEKQYDSLRFWDFVHADLLKPATQETFIKLITSGILAADPKLASLRTIGKLLVRMFIKFERKMVNNLNGPTTLTLIEPWVRKITSYPHVKVHMDHTLVTVESINKQIESVTFTHSKSNDTTTVKNSGDDMFIVAIPAERMAEIVKNNEGIKSDAPSLAGIEKLFVNNQNGLQFFLTEDIPMIRGHVSYTYSKWAVTSISQAQFWEYDWSKVADGTVKGVLSVDISTWNLPGEPEGPSKGRAGTDVDRQTFVDEVWYQMHKSLPGLIPRNMSDVVHTAFLDPDVAVNSQGKLEGLEPLFINTVNASEYQPESYTEIRNLFLASDYTATDFNVACMESANESARRAANALLERIGSSSRSNIYKWTWPIEFLIPQKVDCIRMKNGNMPIGWDKKPHEFDVSTSRFHKYASLLEKEN